MGAEPIVQGLPEFGSYEVLGRLGEGGMAEVYLARMQGEGGFERLVAIKRMLEGVRRNPEAIEMFFQEARFASCIRSPHVVPCLDVGRSNDGSPYMVLELIRGGTLYQWTVQQRVDSQVPDAGTLLEWIAQAAQGLHDAHQACAWDGTPLHVVHRDIAPDNILIGLDGVARISDFGIALARPWPRLTQLGTFKGRLSYASPERVRAESVDHRTDIFSLGVVAWEALTGSRLFYHEGGVAPTIHQVLSRPIPDVHHRRPDLPASISEVLQCALARDPDDRFQTAEAFAVAIRYAAREAGLSRRTRELRAEAREWLQLSPRRSSASQSGERYSGRTRRTHLGST